MTLLSKEDLIGGSSSVIEVEIPKLGTVKLRPLTALEYQVVKSRKLKGMTTTTSSKKKEASLVIDFEKTAQNDFESDCIAVSMSLVEPKLTVDEVKKIRQAGVLELLAKNVYDITGVSEEALKEIEKFRIKP